MRFGSFVFSISADEKGDHDMIGQTLREIELAEEVGFDAVWLTEHHFDGAVAYADPVVFGAAVAARTKRVLIGFAVVEMALHHPVRLAVQTSLLDNISNGRLIMGIGRGSAYNEYEYIGFGTTLERGKEMLDEAEELLIRLGQAKMWFIKANSGTCHSLGSGLNPTRSPIHQSCGPASPKNPWWPWARPADQCLSVSTRSIR